MSTRAYIKVDNTEHIFPLVLDRYWNDKSDEKQWAAPPPALIEPGTVTTIQFGGNDRAGCIYKTQLPSLKTTEVKMAFTCPKSSGNSAEGNAMAGLQEYSDGGTPVTFTYKIRQGVKADWWNGAAHSNAEAPDVMSLPDEPVYHP